MSIDEPNVALPSLYGAPAYARPPGPVPTKDRPFDPDQLPLEAHQTDEEREFTSTLPPRAYAPGGIDLAAERAANSASSGTMSARSFSLRAIAGRLLRS